MDGGCRETRESNEEQEKESKKRTPVDDPHGEVQSLPNCLLRLRQQEKKLESRSRCSELDFNRLFGELLVELLSWLVMTEGVLG